MEKWNMTHCIFHLYVVNDFEHSSDCGAEATPIDNNRQRVQPSGRRQLLCQFHSLFVFQFQIPCHFPSPHRPPRRCFFGSNIGCSVKNNTRCYDDRARRCSERGARIVAVDTVRTSGAAAAVSTETTHDLSHWVQRVLASEPVGCHGGRDECCCVRRVVLFAE